MLNIAVVLRYVDMQRNDSWDDRWYIMDDFMNMAKKFGVGMVAVMNEEAADTVWKYCDGLIIPGSATDIDPSYFGGKPFDPPTTVDEYALDATLMKRFYEAGKPIFGVCGGEQAINVYFGGTLSKVPDAMKRDECKAKHVIDIEGGSFVHDVFKAEKYEVNSYHSWRVDEVAPDLRTVAWAPDSTIEAIEWKEKNIFATQWHPERSFRAGDSIERKFFAEFFRKCEACK